MDSREFARKIMTSCSDMDWMDYVEMYDEELNALSRDIDKAKEMNLDYILSALELLSN